MTDIKKPDVRAVLRANMLDGDEGGTLTMRAKDFLDEVCELVDPLLEQAFEDGYQYRVREDEET